VTTPGDSKQMTQTHLMAVKEAIGERFAAGNGIARGADAAAPAMAGKFGRIDAEQPDSRRQIGAGDGVAINCAWRFADNYRLIDQHGAQLSRLHAEIENWSLGFAVEIARLWPRRD
jgi:hypothetical protein